MPRKRERNPFDYGKLPTEQNNPKSRRLDRASTLSILKIMSREDRSVPLAVWQSRTQIEKAVGLITAAIKNSGRLFFIGAGTSGRFAVMEAAECPPTFGTSPSLVQALMAGGKNSVFRSREGAEDSEVDGFRKIFKAVRAGDILIGIAASGVTPFVAGGLRAAKKRRARTVLVTCNQSIAAKSLVDCLIAVTTGPEVISGSTRLKAGTATKLVLNMLTVATMVHLGKVYQNWMVDVQPRSKKLRARAVRLIETIGNVSAHRAQKYFRLARQNVKAAIVMARTGASYPQALRRLKSSSGFLHPIIESQQRTIVIASDPARHDYLRAGERSNLNARLLRRQKRSSQ